MLNSWYKSPAIPRNWNHFRQNSVFRGMAESERPTMLFCWKLLSLADTGRILDSHTKRDTEVGGDRDELKNKRKLKVAVSRDGLDIFTRTLLDILRLEAKSEDPNWGISRLWHSVSHGKCVGSVDSGVDMRWGYCQLRGKGFHTPYFSFGFGWSSWFHLFKLQCFRSIFPCILLVKNIFYEQEEIC